MRKNHGQNCKIVFSIVLTTFPLSRIGFHGHEFQKQILSRRCGCPESMLLFGNSIENESILSLTVPNRVYVGHSCRETYPVRAHVHVYVREATSAFMFATRVAKRKRSELTSTSTSGRTTFAARRTPHFPRAPRRPTPAEFKPKTKFCEM